MRILLLLIATSLLLSCKNNAVNTSGKDPALEKVNWTLTEIAGNASAIPATDPPHLVFEGAAFTFSGHAGCNQCNGMYTCREDMIKIHVMAVTKKACESMELETAFLKQLEDCNRYTLEQSKKNKTDATILRLYKDDQLLMQFKSGPLPPAQP